MKKIFFIFTIFTCLFFVKAAFSKSINDEYKGATDLVKKDLDEAKIAFINFIKNHPNEELTGNAHFWLSEIYRLKENFIDAANGYLVVLNKFPNNKHSPMSSVGLAVSLINLNEITTGCKYLSNFEKLHPKADKGVISKSDYYKEQYCNSNRAKEVAETKITSLKCKDFGYVEGTEKFADCMLELTKLKLKQQQQQQQSSSNDTGVSDAMREANRIARAKALIQLGERLGRPPATSVMPFPKQQNCKLNPLNNRIVCN